jgi:hypothetical protein
MIRITEPEKAKHSGNTREDLSYEAIVGALQAIMDCTGLITDYQRVSNLPSICVGMSVSLLYALRSSSLRNPLMRYNLKKSSMPLP